MKARLLATGDTYKVITCNEEKWRYLLEDGNWYNISEIELLDNEIDWQQVRIQLAGMAMQGMCANENCIFERKEMPKAAVRLADALIAKLQGKPVKTNVKTDKTDDEFLTTKQACKILQVSNMTLYRWEKQGILVPVRFGGRRKAKRYLLSDIMAKKGGQDVSA